MTRLSVNINKVATLRNARGHNTPNVLEIAQDIERYGAQGITVHPRPDERHIRYNDVIELSSVLNTEFNIEGNPNKKFIDLVLRTKPTQVTLVPDAPDVLTSNAGWDTVKHKSMLKEVLDEFKANQIRTSIFVGTNLAFIEGAKNVGAHRIELYTEPYANLYSYNNEQAIKPFVEASALADKLDLGINAGHDLNLTNLKYFVNRIPSVKEVSIGHALISDSLYFGLQNTVQMYLAQLNG